MRKQYEVDPFIGQIVNIRPVYFKENANVYFTAASALTGTYTFKVWNSDKKNTEYTTAGGALTVLGEKMTLTIKPEAQGIPVGEQYFEIWHNESSRIITKGIIYIFT